MHPRLTICYNFECGNKGCYRLKSEEVEVYCGLFKTERSETVDSVPLPFFCILGQVWGGERVDPLNVIRYEKWYLWRERCCDRLQ